MNVALRAKTTLLMLRRREAPDMLRELANRLCSDGGSYILRRDLMIPPTPRPRAKIPFQIRLLASDDLPQIVAERPRRLPVLLANIPSCYVATTEDGSICYMNWMVATDQQNRFRPYFLGTLLDHGEDTVLMEFAYTFERFRGIGLMGAALAQIVEKGLDLGARWAVTYVKDDNIASLKGCAKAGFRPYMFRCESWRGFRLRQSFRKLEPGASYPFETSTANLPPGSHERSRRSV